MSAADDVLRKLAPETFAKVQKIHEQISDLTQRLDHLERQTALIKRLDAAWLPPGAKPNGHLVEGI